MSCDAGWTLTSCSAHPEPSVTLGAFPVDNACVFTFVPADADFQGALSPKALGLLESRLADLKRTQLQASAPKPPPQEVGGSPLPNFSHIQMKVMGYSEDPRPLLTPELKSGVSGGGEGGPGDAQTWMEAAMVVHRSLEEENEQEGTPAQGSSPACPLAPAPLASFHDDLDMDSSEGSSPTSSPADREELHPGPQEPLVQRGPLDLFHDFALIDDTPTSDDMALEKQAQDASQPPNWKLSLRTKEKKKATVVSSSFQPEEEEEDLYYGLPDIPEDPHPDKELGFEPDTQG
ncbi:barttin-like [Thomomys bottae]